MAAGALLLVCCEPRVLGRLDLDESETREPDDQNVAGVGPQQGGAAGAGGGGTGGTMPADCAEDSDCSGMTPICDAGGQCRACTGDSECPASTPFCVESGVCGVCRDNSHCEDPQAPICGALGECAPCSEHAQCDSLACATSSGQCVDESRIAYALAGTGVTGACGSRSFPCRTLEQAARLLTADRPVLVFLPTAQSFISGTELPAIDGLLVVGNDVALTPFGDNSALTVTGGSVTLHGLDISGAGDSYAGVDCTSGSASVRDSSFSDNTTAVRATGGCNLTVEGSTLLDSTGYAIEATCSSCTEDHELTVERTWFEGNVSLINTTASPSLVRNNVFVSNGGGTYNRLVNVWSNGVLTFAFNTFYRNWELCRWVGLVSGNTDADVVSSNIFFDSFPPELTGLPEPCYDQVLLMSPGATIENNLTEIVWPGTDNRTGNPRFADAPGGDFTPGSGSPAIDHGAASGAPDVDFLGNPRPAGASPDIGAIEVQ